MSSAALHFHNLSLVCRPVSCFNSPAECVSFVTDPGSFRANSGTGLKVSLQLKSQLLKKVKNQPQIDSTSKYFVRIKRLKYLITLCVGPYLSFRYNSETDQLATYSAG